MRKKNEKLWNQLTSQLKDFKIEAGWFENTRYDDNTSVAKIARVQNYGAHIHQTIKSEKQRNFLHFIGIHLKEDTKDLNIIIPPRPFYDNAEKRITGPEGYKIVMQELLRVFEAKQTMEQAANRIGLWMQRVIQEEIKKIESPPLAESTIQARERSYKSKSKNRSTKPLNASGLMFATVQNKVTMK